MGTPASMALRRGLPGPDTSGAGHGLRSVRSSRPCRTRRGPCTLATVSSALHPWSKRERCSSTSASASRARASDRRAPPASALTHARRVRVEQREPSFLCACPRLRSPIDDDPAPACRSRSSGHRRLGRHRLDEPLRAGTIVDTERLQRQGMGAPALRSRTRRTHDRRRGRGQAARGDRMAGGIREWTRLRSLTHGGARQ